jgi:hypothetical protein
MKCLKCGEPQTESNNKKKSCREHTFDKNGSCTRCPGEPCGNCYHEWVHFYTLWIFISSIRTFLNKHLYGERPRVPDEYVEL